MTATAGGKASATVSWSAPADRRGRRPRTGHARSSASTAQTPTDGHRHPARDHRHGHRADERHDLHLHGAGDQPDGTGPASAPSNAVTPLTAVAPRRRPAWPPQPAPARRASPGRRRRPTATAPITGYTVTPYIGATRRRPSRRPRRRPRDRDGADERHRLHVQGHGDQRRRHGRGVGRARTPSRRRRRSSTSAPRDRRLGRRRPVELGVKFKSDVAGTITGIRFYKATQHRYPRRQPLDHRGTLLAHGDVRQRDRLRLADRSVRQPGVRSPRHDLRRLLLRAERATTRRPQRLRPARRQPPLHALADATSCNGVYTYSATSTFPTSTLPADQLLGRRHVRGPGPGQVTGAAHDEGRRPEPGPARHPSPAARPPTSYRRPFRPEWGLDRRAQPAGESGRESHLIAVPPAMYQDQRNGREGIVVDTSARAGRPCAGGRAPRR